MQGVSPRLVGPTCLLLARADRSAEVLQQLRSDRLAGPHPRAIAKSTCGLRPGASWNAPIQSVLDLGLDELGQQSERFLPAQIARLGRNDFGHPFLHDA